MQVIPVSKRKSFQHEHIPYPSGYWPCSSTLGRRKTNDTLFWKMTLHLIQLYQYLRAWNAHIRQTKKSVATKRTCKMNTYRTHLHCCTYLLRNNRSTDNLKSSNLVGVQVFSKGECAPETSVKRMHAHGQVFIVEPSVGHNSLIDLIHLAEISSRSMLVCWEWMNS